MQLGDQPMKTNKITLTVAAVIASLALGVAGCNRGTKGNSDSYGSSSSDTSSTSGSSSSGASQSSSDAAASGTTGSANQAAARRAAAGLAEVAREAGVPRGHLAILSYQAGAPDSQPPIRVSYSKVVASAGPCGRWPEDLTVNAENKHYADFGCSYQNNLAAQVANPNDLIGPRKQSDIDAENRGAVIDLYRTRGISNEFLGNSEVTY